MFGSLERSLIIRACSLWLLVRLLFSIAFLLLRASAPFVAASGHPLFLPPSAAVLVIAVTATLSWLVTRRCFEDLMLANLGTPPWTAALLVSLPPLVLEVLIAQIGGV